ncbi:MAG: nuclear scaffold-like protein p76 [Isosphaeraceae bacterium]|jgi:Flp pilus assembly protein TadD|nr:MAG: nuclear scaffold-like protein p76 [Isosphaeraceae bacterium]
MPTPDDLYETAIQQRDAGDKDAALATLKQAFDLDSNFAIGHGLAAKLCADLGHFDEAIAHARKVVELEPDDAFSYTALSVIYQRCGRIPEAEEAKARAYYKQMGID